jgi:acyl-CoA synthetase (AMP-forming)/AMP-acid ligase II
MSTFPDRLKQAYQTQPDFTILTLLHTGQEDQPVTYRELIEGAAGYAATYAGQGIQAGEVIILILEHGRDLLFAFWGAILQGAIPSIMPFLTEKLLPERYRADLAALVAVTQPAAIVTYPEFEAEIRPALKADDSVRTVILSSQAQPPRVPDFAGLSGFIRRADQVVLLQHSSGTTGLQKGVALSHQAVFNQISNLQAAIQQTGQDVFISWLPLYHDMGLIAGFLLPILSGNHLVLMSPFDWVRAPYRLMQAVSKYRGTLSWLPNFAYYFCAQKIRERQMEGVDLSSWRAVINCSEPVRDDGHQAFAEKFAPYGFRKEALQVSYAMAENVFAVTQTPPGKPPTLDVIDRDALQTQNRAIPAREGQPSVRMVSCGRPIPNVEVRIVTPQNETLPERTIGEVAVRSDCILNEYYHRPEASAKAIIPGGWYLTGDYGYLADGNLYISGRKKDLIIVGGKNIYPQDLEILAMEVEGVHPGRVSAFGVFDESKGTEDVVIVAEVESADAERREKIEEDIRALITRGSAVALRNVYLVGPGWMVKTSSGKNARLANRDKYLRESGDTATV